MGPAILESQLPPHTRLPKALQLLCEFSIETGTDFLTGNIALTPNGPENLEAWVRMAPSLGTSLFVFARDVAHALFALWMYETRDLEQCPVVRLDSEGVENRVVASNPSDFAWCLADGRSIDDDGRPMPELQAWLAPRLARPAETIRPTWATDNALDVWIRAGITAAVGRPPIRGRS